MLRASEELRNDREIVLEAVKKSPWCLKFASEELKMDKKLIIIALKEEYFVNYIKFKNNQNQIKFEMRFYHDFLRDSFQKILEFY